MTTKFAVTQHKGGVAKTTMTATVATYLAMQGFKTLVVDADPQGSLTAGMNIQPYDGFLTLLRDGAEWSEVMKPVPESYAGDIPLYVLGGYRGTRLLEKDNTTTTLMMDRFAELEGYMDVIFFDTSPGLSEVHNAVYFTVDYAIMPTHPQRPSIESLIETASHLEATAQAGAKANFETARPFAIVPTMFDARMGVQRENIGYVEGRMYNVAPTLPPIHTLTVWQQAAQFTESIWTFEADDARSAKRARSEVRPLCEMVAGAV